MDKEMRESIRDMEEATGNPVRIREMPDGEILLDFSTPGKKKAISPLRNSSRRERRRKFRKKPTTGDPTP